MAELSYDTESMVRSRRSIVLLSLIGWGIWVASMILQDMNVLSPNAHFAVMLIGLCAWAVWVVALVRQIRFGLKMKTNPALAAALTDELWQQSRSRAIGYAFFASIACEACIVIISDEMHFPLTARSGAEITMFVGVVTCFISFLLLDRD